MKYYRFSWKVSVGDTVFGDVDKFSQLISAETEEEARAILEKSLQEDWLKPLGEPQAEELTVGQLVDEEEEEIRRVIRNWYIFGCCGEDVSIRNYAEACRELSGKNEAYLEALKEANRILRLAKLARRKLDLTKITVAELFEGFRKLHAVTDPDEFNRIFFSFPVKEE